VAEQLQQWLRDLEGEVPMGTVDITLYRDDAATALPNPRIGPSEIPHSLAGAQVIIVDDVLYTGRTVRAAIDALMDYGRPARVELAVLVEREGRELPIQADYVVRSLQVGARERVDVVKKRDGIEVVVQPNSAPTVPPERP
jgi:pyrimidine operon attenuation protein/uracil phosphoribosyltransferase